MVDSARYRYRADEDEDDLAGVRTDRPQTRARNAHHHTWMQVHASGATPQLVYLMGILFLQCPAIILLESGERIWLHSVRPQLSCDYYHEYEGRGIVQAIC